jgi:hypothetical protein
MTQLGNFVRSIADQLRGVYKPTQYGSVVLPFTIPCKTASPSSGSALENSVRELAGLIRLRL